MSSLFDNIGVWMEGLSPFMTFITILWVVTIVVFRKAFTDRIKKFDFTKINIFRKKKGFKHINLLKDHDLFNVIERVRSEVKLKKFYTSGEYDRTKTKMFVDFMSFYLTATRNSYKEFFLDNTLNNLNTDELKSTVFTLLNESRKQSAKQTKAHFLQKGITVEDSDYIINLFEQWRHETHQAVETRINGIFSSDFHSNNFEKLLACLEILSMSIDLIPKDGVESFEKMNGRFMNLPY